MLCLEPDYLKDFLCDGQRCGAQCCRLWTVFVDGETYGKYEKLEARQREELLGHLKEEGTGDERYAWDFSKGKACHFLQEDCLCQVQLRLGEEYLGNTCALYPRKAVNIGGSFQRSLSLSCPLAAELVIFRDRPILFKWQEIINSRPGGWQKIACQKGADGVAAACRLLQDTGLNILQLKHRPLLERLATLMAYLKEADRAVEAGDFGELLHLSDQYNSGKGQREEGLSWNLAEQFPGLKEALAVPRQKNQHLQSLHEIEPRAGASLPPFELMLENILAAEYFVELFPCTLGGTLQHNGRAFLGLSLLFRETLLPYYEAGDKGGLLHAVTRIATLMGHDRDWQNTMSKKI